MKVFISWSGEISHQVALVLREWLPSVIQAVEPYVSSEDIDKGARWTTDISKELEASQYGILCVTPQNIEAPWLNFEAGALSKTIDKSRVCPFLFGLKRSEIRTGPLLQFQSTIYERDDLAKMLHGLNNSGEARHVEEGRLETIFGVWWPKLEDALNPLLALASTVGSKPQGEAARPSASQSDILEELLELVRNQQKLLTSPETLLPLGYLEFALRRGSADSMGPLGPLGPEALEALEGGWRRLRDVVATHKEGESLSSISNLVMELEAPLQYLVRRSRGLARLPRKPLPSDS